MTIPTPPPSHSETPRPCWSSLRRLPLHRLHQQHGAQFASIAGYELPLSYRSGVRNEHLHTRTAASVFDMSHMGQLLIRPRSGTRTRDVALALESLMPLDLLSLPVGRQRYGFLTTSAGGIHDDLIIARLVGGFLVIVNAARAADDEAYLRSRIGSRCQVQALTDRALLAIQGPRACEALQRLAPGVAHMRFMEASEQIVAGALCWVMRSGYTGEDGYEVSLPIEAADDLLQRLLEDAQTQLAGLGARDSLRMEAGRCAYGSDITAAITPVQAALESAIAPSRRSGGLREGGFPGAPIILRQLSQGVSQRRVGLCVPLGVPLANACLFAHQGAAEPIGHVTSVGFGASLNAPLAMGYVRSDLALPGTRLQTMLDGHRIATTVTALPFRPHQYRRATEP